MGCVHLDRYDLSVYIFETIFTWIVDAVDPSLPAFRHLCVMTHTEIYIII